MSFVERLGVQAITHNQKGEVNMLKVEVDFVVSCTTCGHLLMGLVSHTETEEVYECAECKVQIEISVA